MLINHSKKMQKSQYLQGVTPTRSIKNGQLWDVTSVTSPTEAQNMQHCWLLAAVLAVPASYRLIEQSAKTWIMSGAETG